jgi:hypothetical protein
MIHCGAGCGYNSVFDNARGYHLVLVPNHRTALIRSARREVDSTLRLDSTLELSQHPRRSPTILVHSRGFDRNARMDGCFETLVKTVTQSVHIESAWKETKTLTNRIQSAT